MAFGLFATAQAQGPNGLPNRTASPQLPAFAFAPPLPEPPETPSASPRVGNLPAAPPGPAEEVPAGPATPLADQPPPAALVAAGQAAFGNACTACHDADKALSKRKNFAQWRATVERMASKDGAEVPAGDVAAIAAYLTSLCASPASDELPPVDCQALAHAGAPGVMVYGTLSPTWRGGSDELQNSGFFPDAWVGVGVQTGSPLSGRVTSCISCHTEAGEGSRLELVEAALHLDLTKSLGNHDSLVRSSVDAGRFIVPFGAFAQQSNPGVYRTVTKPLIYNMGLRVLDEDLGDPVLPMPYSDEGAVFNLSGLLWSDVAASWDTYLVNGLQGGAEGIDFDLSRDYVDNNSRPAVGTRVTVGNSLLRLGSSFMAGDAAPTGGIDPTHDALFYRIYGCDAAFHYQDLIRLQFEYARRDSDRLVSAPGPILTRDHVAGFYLEGEMLVSRAYGITFLVRYDQQDRTALAPPPESSLATGSFSINRLTYGFNFRLPGGSLLMIDYERWNLPATLGHQDVVGARWAYSF